MNREKFKKFLEQHCELGDARELTYHSPSHEPMVIERHCQSMTLTNKNNPTKSKVIKRLKPNPQPCEDCGQSVSHRRVELKRYVFPQPHWREICETCNTVKNPQTGEFDIDKSVMQGFFVGYFNRLDK